MAKAKKARISKATSGAGAGGAKKIHATSNNPHSNNNPNKKQKGASQQQQKQQKNQKPIVPFGRDDRILLVGEGERVYLPHKTSPPWGWNRKKTCINGQAGDFSFTRSLVAQHQCRNVLATCYDSKEELHEKYPLVEETLQEINSARSSTKSKKKAPAGDGNDPAPESEDQQDQNPRHGPKVLCSIDARKLGQTVAGGGKEVKMGLIPHDERRPKKIPAWKLHQKQQQQQQQQQKQQKQNPTKAKKKQGQQTPEPSGPWDIICFNFPHVGGLSTDVNRQVRSNQELLVAFFKASVPLLSLPSPTAQNNWDDDSDSDEEEEEEEDYDSADQNDDNPDHKPKEKPKPRTEPGQILVTLFEGEPYTLWNIRDLARHCGLKVVTSFRFPWASYEGYTHARTLGHIEQKNGGGGRGGWKGEERDARMYVFEVNRTSTSTSQSQGPSSGGGPAKTAQESSGAAAAAAGSKRKKRTRDDESDSDSE